MQLENPDALINQVVTSTYPRICAQSTDFKVKTKGEEVFIHFEGAQTSNIYLYININLNDE